MNSISTASSAASTLFTKSLSDLEGNMTVTTKRSIIALLLSLVLVVSLFTVSISAATDPEDSSTAVESVTEGESTTEKESSSEKETTKKEEATESAAQKAEREAKEEKTKTLIINGVIIGVIVLIIVVLVIKFHKKLGDFLRSVKSELKKIVWSSKENTRKGFLVVIVVAIAVAIVLALIDLAFNTGISMLADLFN